MIVPRLLLALAFAVQTPVAPTLTLDEVTQELQALSDRLAEAEGGYLACQEQQAALAAELAALTVRVDAIEVAMRPKLPGY